ncbi:MAG TPA: DNA topoisomerase I [Candidatus Methanoperedens sp.]|nr:DNA topoisomerase I [Candidatus Methanoperedens sp.]HLB69832.1 DNA topoisomerase I [Candidatus Methanoperedens sp.]
MHLIITEKHDTARRIADILSGKKPTKERVSGVDTYRLDGKTVMGLSGHIVEVDFPKDYNNWQKTDLKDLIHAKILTTPTHANIVTALRKLGKEAQHLTIATDYDREGELIGVEALNVVKKVNPNINADRVRYSTITPGEIKKTFASPTKIDFDLAAAGESRQVIDLIWGAVLTRFVSLSSGRLGDKFLSVGRVQSPTLAIIVNREKERKAFVPVPYWELFATLVNGGEFEAEHKKGRFPDKSEAEAIKAKLGETGTVKSIELGKRNEKPPVPFNTTEFLRSASSIGISAANAMRIAEYLYVNGFISYPRTDNTVYPQTLDTKSIIASFLDTEFHDYAQKLLSGKLMPTKGKKETTDHPPIHPATPARRSDLKDDEWKIYELVVRRFFATFADETQWETMAVTVDISGEEFGANGARLVKPGWRWYYSYNVPEDRILPQLKEGQILTVKEINLIGKETQPPSRYGQGHLIKIMDDLGLGTKSTRHEIISKLYSRAYVVGNPLQPTRTAFAVIEALEKYANTITKPEMTSELEQDMDAISEGKIKEEQVIQVSRDMLDEVFKDMDRNKELISESLKNGLYEDRIIGTCMKCSSDLIIRKSKKGSRFIGCSGYPNCDFTLPLPRTGQIVVTENQCKDHGLNLIKIINKGKRPWDIGCPHCNFIEWQKKLDEEKKKSDAIAAK